jgi:hypothetical protein
MRSGADGSGNVRIENPATDDLLHLEVAPDVSDHDVPNVADPNGHISLDVMNGASPYLTMPNQDLLSDATDIDITSACRYFKIARCVLHPHITSVRSSEYVPRDRVDPHTSDYCLYIRLPGVSYLDRSPRVADPDLHIRWHVDREVQRRHGSFIRLEEIIQRGNVYR